MTLPQRIQDFLEEQKRVQGSDGDNVTNLYNEWMAGMDDSVAAFREKLDPWFMKCYSIICKNLLIDTDMRGETEDCLKQEFDKLVNESDLSVKAGIVLQAMSFSDFLDKVVKCVEKEQDLIIKYKKEKEKRVRRVEDEAFYQRIKEVEQLRKSLESVFVTCTLDPNKVHQSILDGETLLTVCQIWAQNLYEKLDDLSSQLKTRLGTWLKDFQLKYAELAVPSNFDDMFKQLSEWCDRVGKLLYDSLTMVTNEQQNSTMTLLIGEELRQRIKQLYHGFLKSTFIVTKQTMFYVKPNMKKPFPKVEICMLGAAHIPRTESVIAEAIFVSEDDIKDDTDITCLKNKSRELLASTKKMNLGTSPLVFKFDNITFKEQFQRKQQTGQDQKPVHEDKYRLLFHLNFEQTTYLTWSMPLVVTKASNQDANALASIMWQCHSTDVFVFPSNISEKLPWDNVADMLQLKVKTLTPKHCLTEENLRHLKYKLLGASRHAMDENVTLNKFCQDPMEFTCTDACKKGFSFWKWFLGTYNLIEKHLLPYWENGLIIGFIKKKTAMEKLSSELYLPGTCIFRFSETKLDNSDGIKDVYGELTSVVKLSETCTHTSVEQNNETSGGKKRKVFENKTENQFDFWNVADCQSLTKDKLAVILRRTRSENDHEQQAYLYAYPSNGAVTTLFYRLDPKVVKNKKKTNTGYKSPDRIDSVDLGQSFGKMNIKEGSPRHEDDVSDGKKPRLDIQERGDIFCQTDTDRMIRNVDQYKQPSSINHMEPNPDIITPSFDSNGMVSPALDYDIVLKEAHVHVHGLAKYLSAKQHKLLKSWVFGPSNTNWQIEENEIEEGLNNDVCLDDIMDILGHQQD